MLILIHQEGTVSSFICCGRNLKALQARAVSDYMEQEEIDISVNEWEFHGGDCYSLDLGTSSYSIHYCEEL